MRGSFLYDSTDLDGKKDVLVMWAGENEITKVWTAVLNGVKNCGIEDIFIACSDNRIGVSDAIKLCFLEQKSRTS